ncbi:MAG: sensor histidine kinase [Psychrilyobacter sp.]|nr:sensor histidine kinase [Psychrilyobacter sp.]
MKSSNKAVLKLFFRLFLLFSFFLFLTSYVLYKEEVNHRFNDIKKEKEIILNLIDSDLEYYFSDFSRDINYLSSIITFRHLLNDSNSSREDSSDALEKYLAIKNKYSSIIIRDLNQNIVVSAFLNTDDKYNSYIKAYRDEIPDSLDTTIFHEITLPNLDSIFTLTTPIYNSNYTLIGSVTLFWSKKLITKKLEKYMDLDLLSTYKFYWLILKSSPLDSKKILGYLDIPIGEEKDGSVIQDDVFFTFNTIDLKEIKPKVTFSESTSTIWKVLIKVPKKELIKIRAKIFKDFLYLSCFLLFLISILLWIILKETSKRKFYEIQLEEKNKKLIENDINKDKFLSILAHDLKSPFAGITGIFSLITKKYEIYDDEKKKKLIFSLNDSIQSINILLNNLLEWKQLQRGRLQPVPIEINVNNLTFKVLKQISLNLNKKNIILSNNISDDHFILADKNMVETILRNIVANAIKFTPTFGKIDITSEIIDEYIAISIRDSGIGMSLKIQSDISNSLNYNLTTLGTENEKGTGLGLVITKEFITLNHGILEIDSMEGVGTNVIVKLPIYKKI